MHASHRSNGNDITRQTLTSQRTALTHSLRLQLTPQLRLLSPQTTATPRSVKEFAIGVYTEQCFTHGWQGALPQQTQSGLKGVIKIDLPAGANNDNTTRTDHECSVSNGLPHWLERWCDRGITCLPSATGFSLSIVAEISLPTFSLYSLAAASMAFSTMS